MALLMDKAVGDEVGASGQNLEIISNLEARPQADGRARCVSGWTHRPPRGSIIHACPQYRERERLGARDDAVEFEIFLRGMGIAADRADAANRRRADARGEAGVGAAAGKFALDVGQAGIPGRRAIGVEHVF
jgi:hypothetical protein